MVKVVHVRWVDSADVHGWQSKRALRRHIRSKPCIIDSVGMLVHKGKKKIVLIAGIGSDEATGIFEIPRPCIRSMKTIGKLPITIDEK